MQPADYYQQKKKINRKMRNRLFITLLVSIILISSCNFFREDGYRSYSYKIEEIENIQDTIEINNETIKETKEIDLSEGKKVRILITDNFSYYNNQIYIETIGFLNSNKIAISDIFPMYNKILISDINNDGNKEFYIIHECTGTSREEDFIFAMTFENDSAKIIDLSKMDSKYYKSRYGGNSIHLYNKKLKESYTYAKDGYHSDPISDILITYKLVKEGGKYILKIDSFEERKTSLIE